MSKLDVTLNKYLVYAIYLLLAFSLIGNVRSCGTNKENKRLRKEVTALTEQTLTLTNAINDSFYDKDELSVRLEILGYEVSKRMLYDQNAIVRTVVRPDDRMNEYDEKIKELTKKLN